MKVLLGVPSNGYLTEGAAQASWLASLDHQVVRHPSCQSGPNFNELWCTALNEGKAGNFTHFAMMHSDIRVIEDEAGKRWLDRLIEELESVGGDLISVPNAIKDHRGLVSSGIGDPANPWNPWRRFTTDELEQMPMTFAASDIGYGDKYLLHNEAMCLWDLRKPLWYETFANGEARAVFNFTEKIQLVNGRFRRFQKSEDWTFSRDLWRMGAKTYLTRRIELRHMGQMEFENRGCGTWQHDEATRANWDPDHPADSLTGEQKAVLQGAADTELTVNPV